MARIQKVRRGLTLVELLIVIAVIGLLLAISLPAIQAARESSRRSNCANHLREIGIALHSFEAANRSLPAGYISKSQPGIGDIGPGWGWSALLLNYIEETSLHRCLNFDDSIESSTNSAHRTQVLSIYSCPSDVQEASWSTFSAWGDFDAAPASKICDVASANYTAMAGSGDLSNGGNADTGLFFRNSRCAFRQITDGASRTIAVGERSSSKGNATWVGSVTGALLPLGQYDDTESRYQLFFRPAAMVLGQVPDVPDDPLGKEGMFSSQHPGGILFAFADGHIAFLSTETDFNLFAALSTRAGGEPTL